ncbi:MAG TPA: SGNH/GDSL hydrolase family protein [Tepidisphaeraceae bacterium]|nr:SGNH/GDSL hydrolase family protein [Tepidisphaeraceae bacterium]
MRNHILRIWTCLACILFLAPLGQAALRPGDRVAICGDSITEQKIYSADIEEYLLMCKPQPKLKVMQFGWGGETSWGFLARMDNDVLPFKPTVATIFYGMNDGGYAMLSDERARHFQEATTQIVQNFKKTGVRFIVLGSPGAVDTETFHSAVSPAVYNKTLGQLAEMAQAIAKKEHVTFVDVHAEMMRVMKAAKAKYGQDYQFAGPDGVHPRPNGHLVMAYCFLKALGCNGDIGTIRFDAADGKANATDGHEILAATKNSIQVESSKYPFCFFGNPTSPEATSGIIQFFPFNADLNRFMLVVSHAPAQRMKVTFGGHSKDFSRAELEKGINLAAEFLDNPFCPAFKKVEEAVAAQQDFETPAVKQLIHNAPQYRDLLPSEQQMFNHMVTATMHRDEQLRAAAEDAVKPVVYTIEIQPVADKSR